MKGFVKCEMCSAEIPADKCVFATHKEVIEGKEHVFCCARCAETFKKKKNTYLLKKGDQDYPHYPPMTNC